MVEGDWSLMMQARAEYETGAPDLPLEFALLESTYIKLTQSRTIWGIRVEGGASHLH